MMKKRVWRAGAILAAGAGMLEGQIQFTEVGAGAGIQPFVMQTGFSGGVAVADFDNDGDLDVFVPNEQDVANQLYRNLGNGQFEEIAAAAGLAANHRTRMGLWLDYDGDHLLDLFVASDCKNVPGVDCEFDTVTLALYRQVSPGQFEDVSEAAGFTDDLVFDGVANRGTVVAGDLDNNGYLDLYTGLWTGEARLFMNNTDGTFTEISESSGVGGSFLHYWQAMMHDFDGDGWLDIYANVDFNPNKMWINQGDLTFVDVAGSTGLDTSCNEMGMAFGDYDNDRDLDIYVTNIFQFECHNKLFRNDSTDTLQFTEVSEAVGVDQGFFGWGATFFDAENDGDLDLAATNGFFLDEFPADPTRFFRNDGGVPVAFTDASAAVGLDDTFWGSSLVAFDYDRDGDLDLLQTTNGSDGQGHHLRLLENQPIAPGVENNYLVIKPRMEGPNHWAIGTVVHLEVGETSMMRLITAGTSYAGQEPAEAFFGVGTATNIDRVVIEWPGNGGRSELRDVPANQEVTVQILFADGFESGDTSRWTSSNGEAAPAS